MLARGLSVRDVEDCTPYGMRDSGLVQVIQGVNW